MDNMAEKAKGVAKEAIGKLTGDDDTVKEGEAQQKRAQNADEAERLEEQAEEKKSRAAGHKGEQMRRED